MPLLQRMFKRIDTLDQAIGRSESLQRPGRLLDQKISAMHAELEELHSCIIWKPWCDEFKDGRRYEIFDLMGAREEAIDLLFFLLRVFILLDMGPDEVYELFIEKWRINMKRAECGYSATEKRRPLQTSGATECDADTPTRSQA